MYLSAYAAVHCMLTLVPYISVYGMEKKNMNVHISVEKSLQTVPDKAH